MKIKLMLASVFTFLILTSCKNEVSVGDKPEGEKASSLEVVFDLVVRQDDELILFYKDASISYFDDSNTVYAGVKGSDHPQQVRFSVPKGIYPNDIRFDISSNKAQTPIIINSVDLKFEGRTWHIDKKDFNQYFKTNEYLKYDAATATVTTLVIDGKYDPGFYTQASFCKGLEKLLDIAL